MEMNILIVVSSCLMAIVIGLICGICYMRFSKSRAHIIEKANNEAKKIKMEALADSKVSSARVLNNAEQEINEQLDGLKNAKAELNRKKQLLFKDIQLLGDREEQMIEIENNNIKLQKELIQKIKIINEKLASANNLSLEESKAQLWENLKFELNSEISRFTKNLMDTSIADANEKARNILLGAMEKNVIEIVNSNTQLRVAIPDSEMKGKIIGKEGRNIKAFEQYGGVDIIVDETPNSINISSFNPIRREIAGRALKFLIADGRIQPVRIEEALIEEEKKVNLYIEEISNEVLKELRIFDFPNELKILVGKLKFRTSFNQNVLQHCIEVARFASAIAAELNLDSYLALKAGLLHDIGKAVDYEQEGSHVALGAQLLRKFNIDEVIVNAVETHHDEARTRSIYGEIVVIADMLSAARPGARNNNLADFFARMNDLEIRIKSIRGVKQAYALQSGRQIRVIVEPDLIDDLGLIKIQQEIKQVVQKDNKIPGEIVITVIREQRLVGKINSIEYEN